MYAYEDELHQQFMNNVVVLIILATTHLVSIAHLLSTRTRPSTQLGLELKGTQLGRASNIRNIQSRNLKTGHKKY